MTKTLTEQWRDGTLQEGWYYLKVKSELANYPVIAECVINYSSLKPYPDFYEYDDSHVEEVFAPVPSYDEWKQAKENLDKNGTWYTERSYKLLEKQLEIATKALKEYADCKPTEWMTCVTADKALKEMEGVK